MYPHHQNAILNRRNINSSRLLMRSGSAEVQPFMDFSSSSSSSSSSSPDKVDAFNLPLVGRAWGSSHAASTPSFNLFFLNPFSSVASIFRSIFPAIQSLLIPTCQFLVSGSTTSASSLTSRASSRRGRWLTGTFFGRKKGRVSFVVQETPRSEPILLLELATPTSHLVREMASGMVRILLECDGGNGSGTPKNKKKKEKRGALLDEKVWTMYCNGHKLGYATSRPCTASDLHVLGAVQAISVGAGVMPPAAVPTDSTLALPAPAPPHPMEVVVGNNNNNNNNNNEVMYMRAKFERVIGSRDSEAFYMINPDCGGGGSGGKYSSGGPELSIFLLRI